MYLVAQKKEDLAAAAAAAIVPAAYFDWSIAFTTWNHAADRPSSRNEVHTIRLLISY